MRRRKYQMTDRLEKKTFEVKQEGSEIKTLIQMRKNAPARTATRELESEDDAKREFERLCKERESQGWALVESVDDTRGSRSNDAEGAKLLDAIKSDPDDIAPYHVYSDWLTERDDPFGEIVAIGLELDSEKKAAKKKELRRRLDEIAEANGHAIFGELNNSEGVSTSWRRGFFDVFELGVEEPCPLDQEEAVSILFSLRASSVLGGLVLGDFGSEEDLQYGGEAEYGRLFFHIAEQKIPGSFKLLETRPKLVRLGQADVGDVSVLYEHMPQLEVLRLKGADIELGDIALPALRELRLKTRSPSGALADSIVRARFQKLERLIIDVTGRAGEVFDKPSRLLDALPRTMTELALRGVTTGDEMIVALLSSKVLPSLTTIDLSDSNLTSDGARALIQQKDKLARVESLDLSGPLLLRDTVDELRAAFGDRLTISDGVDSLTPGAGGANAELDDDDGYYDEITE